MSFTVLLLFPGVPTEQKVLMVFYFHAASCFTANTFLGVCVEAKELLNPWLPTVIRTHLEPIPIWMFCREAEKGFVGSGFSSQSGFSGTNKHRKRPSFPVQWKRMCGNKHKLPDFLQPSPSETTVKNLKPPVMSESAPPPSPPLHPPPSTTPPRSEYLWR